jgi:hypothetical protein
VTTALIGALIVAVIYVAMRWKETKTENAELRTQIASLKRQLSRRGR